MRSVLEPEKQYKNRKKEKEEREGGFQEGEGVKLGER